MMIRERELERLLEELGGNEELWRDMGSIATVFNSYPANRQVKYANHHDRAGEIDEVVVGHEVLLPYRKSLRKALAALLSAGAGVKKRHAGITTIMLRERRPSGKAFEYPVKAFGKFSDDLDVMTACGGKTSTGEEVSRLEPARCLHSPYNISLKRAVISLKSLS